MKLDRDLSTRLVQKKGTVLLSTSLAWPAVAGCRRAETFSQLFFCSTLYIILQLPVLNPVPPPCIVNTKSYRADKNYSM